MPFTVEQRNALASVGEVPAIPPQHHDSRELRGEHGGVVVAGNDGPLSGCEGEAGREDVVDPLHAPRRHVHRERAVIVELDELRGAAALVVARVVVQFADDDRRPRGAGGEGEFHERAPRREGLRGEGDGGAGGAAHGDGARVGDAPCRVLIERACGDPHPCAGGDLAVGIPVGGAIPYAVGTGARCGDDPDAVLGGGALILEENAVAGGQRQAVEDARGGGDAAAAGGAAGWRVGDGDIDSGGGGTHRRLGRKRGGGGERTRPDDDRLRDREWRRVAHGGRTRRAGQVVGGARVRAVGGEPDVPGAAGAGRRGRQREPDKRARGHRTVAHQGAAGIVAQFRRIEDRIEPVAAELCEEVVGADREVGRVEASDLVPPRVRHGGVPCAERGGGGAAGIEALRARGPRAVELGGRRVVVPRAVPRIDLSERAGAVGMDLLAVVAPACRFQADAVGAEDGGPAGETCGDDRRCEGAAGPDKVAPCAVGELEAVLAARPDTRVDGGRREQGGRAREGGHAGDAILVLMPHEVLHVPGHGLEGAVLRPDEVDVLHVGRGIAGTGGPVPVAEVEVVDHVVLEPRDIEERAQLFILGVGEGRLIDGGARRRPAVRGGAAAGPAEEVLHGGPCGPRAALELALIDHVEVVLGAAEVAGAVVLGLVLHEFVGAPADTVDEEIAEAVVAGGAAHVAEGVLAEGLAETDAARPLRAIIAGGQGVGSAPVQPAAAEVAAQDELVPFAHGRVGEEFAAELAGAVAAAEADGEAVLRVFVRIAAGIAVEVDAAVDGEDGGAVGGQHFHGAGLGHVPLHAGQRCRIERIDGAGRRGAVGMSAEHVAAAHDDAESGQSAEGAADALAVGDAIDGIDGARVVVAGGIGPHLGVHAVVGRDLPGGQVVGAGGGARGESDEGLSGTEIAVGAPRDGQRAAAGGGRLGIGVVGAPCRVVVGRARLREDVVGEEIGVRDDPTGNLVGAERRHAQEGGAGNGQGSRIERTGGQRHRAIEGVADGGGGVAAAQDDAEGGVEEAPGHARGRIRRDACQGAAAVDRAGGGGRHGADDAVGSRHGVGSLGDGGRREVARGAVGGLGAIAEIVALRRVVDPCRGRGAGGGVGAEQGQRAALFAEGEIGVEIAGRGLAVLAAGEDHEAGARGEGAGRKDPAAGHGRVVGQRPAAQVDRSRAGIVQLDPRRKVPVLVAGAVGVAAGHHGGAAIVREELRDDDRAGRADGGIPACAGEGIAGGIGDAVSGSPCEGDRSRGRGGEGEDPWASQFSGDRGGGRAVHEQVRGVDPRHRFAEGDDRLAWRVADRAGGRHDIRHFLTRLGGRDEAERGRRDIRQGDRPAADGFEDAGADARDALIRIPAEGDRAGRGLREGEDVGAGARARDGGRGFAVDAEIAGGDAGDGFAEGDADAGQAADGGAGGGNSQADVRSGGRRDGQGGQAAADEKTVRRGAHGFGGEGRGDLKGPHSRIMAKSRSRGKNHRA